MDEADEDCVKSLGEDDQMTAYKALTDLSASDSVQVLKSLGVCDSCTIYYQLSSLFIFYRESGLPKEALMEKLAQALTVVYDRGERANDQEANTDTAPDDERGAPH